MDNIDINLDCEVMSLAWSTTPPNIYTHVLQYDPIPASIPYQVTQSPLCGAALTYSFLDATGTAAPSWIYGVPDSNLELQVYQLILKIGSLKLSAKLATFFDRNSGGFQLEFLKNCDAICFSNMKS